MTHSGKVCRIGSHSKFRVIAALPGFLLLSLHCMIYARLSVGFLALS